MNYRNGVQKWLMDLWAGEHIIIRNLYDPRRVIEFSQLFVTSECHEAESVQKLLQESISM